MKKSVLVALTAVLVGTASAMAQSIVIEPEQRARIKEFVVKEKVRPAPIRERIAVGAVLPADVELVAVPETWGPSIRQYRYVYWDNRVVLVEPSSRRVVQIID